MTTPLKHESVSSVVVSGITFVVAKATGEDEQHRWRRVADSVTEWLVRLWEAEQRQRPDETARELDLNQGDMSGLSVAERPSAGPLR